MRVGVGELRLPEGVSVINIFCEVARLRWRAGDRPMLCVSVNEKSSVKCDVVRRMVVLTVRNSLDLRSSKTSNDAQGDGSSVLCLAGDHSGRTVGAVTSERLLGLYDRATLAHIRSFGTTAAHADRINELCFSAAGILYSASSDGTLRAWDAVAANAGPSLELSAGAGNEVWSVHVDKGGWLLAAGTETSVMVWDVRHTAKSLVQYEVHTESVTAVRFHPSSSRLLTGSMDGLVCEIDVNVMEEDEAVVGIHNTESPVTAIGFYGPADVKSGGQTKSLAWALSSIDTVTLWDLGACERLQLFDELVAHRSADHLSNEPTAEGRPLGSAVSVGTTGTAQGRAASETTGVQLDYMAGCQWDEWSGRLLMMGGLCDGTAYIFALQDDHRLQVVHSLAAAASTSSPSSSAHRSASSSGHADRIRCFDYGRHSLITGAEDARICVSTWDGAEAAEVQEAHDPAGVGGPSSKKVKRSKDKDKLRVKPY